MKNVVQDLTSGGLLGVWGKWVKHAKYIYNIQDFNPELRSCIYMTPESVYESLTIGGVTSADKGLIRQKKDTLYGIALIIAGFLGQTVLTFVGASNWICFLLYLIGTAVLVYIAIKSVNSIYSRFIERYKKIKERKNK